MRVWISPLHRSPLCCTGLTSIHSQCQWYVREIPWSFLRARLFAPAPISFTFPGLSRWIKTNLCFERVTQCLPELCVHIYLIAKLIFMHACIHTCDALQVTLNRVCKTQVLFRQFNLRLSSSSSVFIPFLCPAIPICGEICRLFEKTVNTSSGGKKGNGMPRSNLWFTNPSRCIESAVNAHNYFDIFF